MKIAELETKITKLSQDNQCHVQNSEAVKKGLEAKLKEQEKELKSEANEAQNLVNSLSKEVEENKKLMAQEKTAALQKENQLKTQVEKMEAEKRYGINYKLISNVFNTFESHICGGVLVSCKWCFFLHHECEINLSTWSHPHITIVTGAWTTLLRSQCYFFVFVKYNSPMITHHFSVLAPERVGSSS